MTKSSLFPSAVQQGESQTLEYVRQDARAQFLEARRSAQLQASPKSADNFYKPNTQQEKQAEVLVNKFPDPLSEEALVRLEAAALPTLLTHIKNSKKSEESRITAVNLLCSLSYTQAIPTLLEVLGSNDPKESAKLKEASASALIAINNVRGELHKEPYASTIRKLYEREYPPEVKAALLAVYTESVGKEALPELNTFIGNKQLPAEIKSLPVLALARLGVGSDQALPTLFDVLHRPQSEGLQTKAIELLGDLPKRAVQVELQRLVEDSKVSSEVRKTAVGALGGQGGKALVESLEKVKTDPDLAPLLLNQIQSRASKLSEETLNKLDALFGDANTPKELRITIAGLLLSRERKNVLPFLHQELQNHLSISEPTNTQHRERRVIVQALQYGNDDKSVTMLEDIVQKSSTNKALRLTALQSLNRIYQHNSTKESYPLLSTLVVNKTLSDEERKEGMTCLRSLATPAAKDLLYRMYTKDLSKDGNLWATAFENSIKVGDPRAEKMILERAHALKDKPLAYEWGILVEGMGKFKMTEGVPYLTSLLKKTTGKYSAFHDELYPQLIESLCSIGEKEGITSVKKELQTEKGQRRFIVAQELAKTNDKDGIAALVAYSKDELYSSKAVSALVRISDPTAAQAVYESLSSPATYQTISKNKDIGEALKEESSFNSFVSNLRKAAASSTDEKREALLSYATALEETKKLDILSPFRLTPSVLVELVKFRQNGATPGTPLAVVTAAKNDHNGTFSQVSSVLTDLMEKGYQVLYYEAGAEEVAETLREATNLKSSSPLPADLWVVIGHGSGKAITFGDSKGNVPKESTKLAELDWSDFNALNDVASGIKEKGSIVLYSCSTGEQNFDNSPHMGELFHKAFPHTHVYGTSEELLGHPKIVWGNGNEVRSVEFLGRAYRY